MNWTVAALVYYIAGSILFTGFVLKWIQDERYTLWFSKWWVRILLLILFPITTPVLYIVDLVNYLYLLITERGAQPFHSSVTIGTVKNVLYFYTWLGYTIERIKFDLFPNHYDKKLPHKEAFKMVLGFYINVRDACIKKDRVATAEAVQRLIDSIVEYHRKHKPEMLLP